LAAVQAAGRSQPAFDDSRRQALPFLACAACFLLAAVAAAVTRGAVSFAHGWWLVAYLLLVGCIAQALLGIGAPLRASRTGGRTPSTALVRWQLGLWNGGTVAVAVADLAGAPAGVLAGSVALLAGLWLFARGFVRAGGGGPPRGWLALYPVLVAFMAGSAIVGCYLAEALPGQ
jgi:hypothetical protein